MHLRDNKSDIRVGPVLTALDVLAGGAVLLLALLAWASLALAHVGHHSLAAVLTLTATAVALLALLLHRRPPARFVRDPAGVVVALACAGVSLLLTFPGFSYGLADKDPGIYVSHAVEIAHTGSYKFTDELLVDQLKDPSFPVRIASPGARFPGLWINDPKTGLIVPQFYHLWPALLATSYDAFGQAGLVDTTPVVAALSILVLCALLRRAGNVLGRPMAGLVAAGAGGLLLAANMMQVWQARYPTTEILAQALFLGIMLGLVIALETRWQPAAGLAGLLLGVGWLNRPDGLVLVLLALGLLAAIAVLGWWDRWCWWFLGGLAVVMPDAILQAYGLAERYTLINGLPQLHLVVELVVGMTVVAVLARLLLGVRIDAQLARLSGRQRELGLVVTALAALLLALGFLRPRLFGVDYTIYHGTQIRSFDEQALHRLSWFLTLPGFGLMLVGLAVVGVRRWRPALWALALPTLLIFPVYAYSARNSSRLMWWTRRYIPTVLPSIIILIALALAVVFAVHSKRARWLQLPSLAALAGLLAVFLSQSLPLRSHNEFKGSFELTAQIAALAHGQQGVFMFDNDPCCEGAADLLPTALWLQKSELAVLLMPNDHLGSPQATRLAVMLAKYKARYPNKPMFLVTSNGALPAGVPPASATPVADLDVHLPMWQESDISSPSARPAPAGSGVETALTRRCARHAPRRRGGLGWRVRANSPSQREGTCVWATG